ncbi:MAG: hypothetical protein IPP70_00390 [Elusimicrobia bacterium]|nr:hypothetical protein [Elusimicrobiota bacterium]
MTRLTPFQWGLSVSVLVHGILFLSLGRRGMSAFDPVWATPDRIDVDLTRPYRLTSDPTQTFRSPHPGTGRPMVVKPTPGPFQEGGGVAPKGREWTLPAPGTKGRKPRWRETPCPNPHQRRKGRARSRAKAAAWAAWARAARGKWTGFS